jgi:cholesterol transport system auxiliary component
VTYYVLDDGAAKADASPAAPPPQKPVLQVPDTAVSGFYDTDQLVFSRSADTRGQYQYARWTARPGKRFTELLRTRLERTGGWQISSAGAYVRGDRLLDTRLIELYHDARSAPGELRLTLRAELVDLNRRSVLGQRVFEQRVPLERYDAAGAAQASGVAVGRVLDELAAWLASLE